MNNEPKNDPSPLSRLPRKSNNAAAFLTHDKVREDVPVEQIEPTLEPVDPTSPRPARAFKGFKFNFGPAFWTIASVISLSVNVILAIVLFVTWINMPSLNVKSVTDMGSGLLGGLYTNFEKMDRAHITRTIPVQATIPVKFDLLLNQQTNVVLSQDVTINNALVTVQTGGLNITRALTTIVLPQGTNLPIVLNLTVPVDTTVPVSLNVEVDIPLSETQLHDPFVGLRKVVEPFYCMINPSALNLDGQQVCK
ncbi:MAG: hypothetical protein HY863_17440 [Chloroflexi bacterium]|nr:hypothetical protein [Chloroflexota bacterium]